MPTSEANDRTSCCAKCADGVEWFWVKRGLLFPSSNREQKYLKFQTQISCLTTVLMYLIGAICLLVAAVTVYLVVSDVYYFESATEYNQVQVVIDKVDEGLSWALFLLQLTCLSLIGVGAFLRQWRHRLWKGAVYVLFSWEALFFLSALFVALGRTTRLGPVIPFDLQFLGAHDFNSTNFDPGYNPACYHNVTRDVLVINDTCEFNLTTTNAVMLYTGYVAGCQHFLPQAIVPWSIVIVAGSSNFMFPARHFLYLAIFPLLTITLATADFMSPNSNFNFGNSVTMLTSCDPSFAYVYWSMIATCATFLLLTGLVAFNMSYIHERDVREMYFWTDFTRIQHDELSTRQNPFTKEHLSKWLHRHSRAIDDAASHSNSLNETPSDVNISALRGSRQNYWEIDSSSLKLINKVAGGASGTVWAAECDGKKVAAKVRNLKLCLVVASCFVSTVSTVCVAHIRYFIHSSTSRTATQPPTSSPRKPPSSAI